MIAPSRVIAVREAEADVELADGQRTTASTVATPDVTVGDYVLLDRGFVLQIISADEAQAILALYAEISSLAEPV
jgi:hydrogenase expression/formation protein HypC